MWLRWSPLWHTEGGDWGEAINVLWTALQERCCYVDDVAMLMTLLRWRRCYVEDVAMWKMLLRWRCCYVDDVATLKTLLRWRCYYVEDVVALKMLLRWWCCHAEDVATLKMLPCWRKKGMCISPMVLSRIMISDIFMGSMKTLKFYQAQFYWFLQKQHKMKNLNNLKRVKTADNIPQVCCPCVEVVQCVIMFHEDHQTL